MDFMGLNGFDLSNHFLVSEHSQVRQLVPSEMVEIGRIQSSTLANLRLKRCAVPRQNLALYEKDQQTLPILWLL